MKNLVTSMACLIILMVFVAQFTQNQVLHHHVTAIDQEVNQFREVIKQEGCITQENEGWLKGRISRILQCSEKEVEIAGDRTPLALGTPVHYAVTVSIGELVAVPDFWGIREEENTMNYQIDRYTVSECVKEKRR